ncbi:MAG: DUF3179 domain-containing protein [bacterium]
MKRIKIIIVVLAFFLVIGDGALCIGQLHEFDLSESLILKTDFMPAGLGKDDIPAILEPKFLDPSRADFLSDEDLVIGLANGRSTKAYPIDILTWHEVVNDTLGDKSVAVTWCPLTRSAVVFNRKIEGELLTFGVSGLLYNNNLVMYDKQSNALWPQLMEGAATGIFSGRKLSVIPSVVTTWGEWKKEHPQTMVLSRDTGFLRDYTSDPYADYIQNSRVIFPLPREDKRLQAKEFIIGVTVGEDVKAYPLEALRNSGGLIEDVIRGEKIIVKQGPAETAFVTDAEGKLIPATRMYWFAWSVFNPQTMIFEVQGTSTEKKKTSTQEIP